MQSESRGHSRAASVPLTILAGQDRARLEPTRAQPNENSRSAPTSPHPGRRLPAPGRGRKKRGRAGERAHFKNPQRQKEAKPVRSPSSLLVQTTGYTLTRSTNKVTMDINTSAFFGDMQQMIHTPPRCKSVDIPAMSNEVRVKALLAEATKARESLQREVVELNVKLDQQQQSHQDHLGELKRSFEEKQEKVSRLHEKAIRELKDKHCRDENDLIERHDAELQALFQEWDMEKDTLQGELEATKQEMEEVKVELAAEAEEKLRKQEEELKQAHSRELRQQEQRLSRQAEEELAGLRELLTLQHSKDMERMAAEHKQEKKDLLAQLDDAAKLEQQLSISNRRVKKLEAEVENLKRTLEETNSQQLNVESKLLDTQRKLREYERSFNTKVQTVEGSYKDRLDSLRRENSQLRVRLMHKTEQHCQYKVQVESSQAKTIRTYQDKMNVILRARSRAEMCTLQGAKPRTKKLSKRPQSAPARHTTAVQSKTSLRSHMRQLMEDHATPRPESSLAHI